ncbi:MAG: acyl-CoA thioesterase [Candidatus Promineifilaceae bacterium]
MSRKTIPTAAQLQTLPIFQRDTITEDQLDALGHLTFGAYQALFGVAWWAFNDAVGLGEAYAQAHHGGIFALESHMTFLAEVNLGETVSIRLRVLGIGRKKLHHIFFMLNETTGRVASLSEGLGAFANLQTRRLAPWPDDITANLNALYLPTTTLDWEAPVCGLFAA